MCGIIPGRWNNYTALTNRCDVPKDIPRKQQTALDGSPTKIAFSRLDWGGNRHTSKLVIRD